MLKNPRTKYQPMPAIDLSDRTWPDKLIETVPIWCSVDLRDGNQALVEPLTFAAKLEMFQLLLEIGFKEIEVGFPSASEVEFEFNRHLIEQKLIPSDVAIQVLTPCREQLIRKTLESVRGAKHAIVHLYNSTSILQRKVVFKCDKSEIIKIALSGTSLVKKFSAECPETKVTFQYSPESFTGTEIDFAVEVCNRVIETWQPDTDHKMIINLPATVEMTTPNIYADQIEYFQRKVNNRDSIIISLHPHNDRGSAIAAAELALQAGADRVEGTLFGNGERTGNVDIVTLALNLYTQGIHPGLEFSRLPEITAVMERLTNIPTHVRHPYAGELVFTAFSGSHQDAINKGMVHTSQSKTGIWEVPYLPIDPMDVGRSYEGIIRINSQSGKGGAAYLMRTEHGIDLPKGMHPEFGAIVQKMSDKTQRELHAAELWELFIENFVNLNKPLELIDFQPDRSLSGHHVQCSFDIVEQGRQCALTGSGNGPINALNKALASFLDKDFDVLDYSQHSIGKGANAEAISFIKIASATTGLSYYGVGIDSNITLSGLKALVSSVNRLMKSSGTAATA